MLVVEAGILQTRGVLVRRRGRVQLGGRCSLKGRVRRGIEVMYVYTRAVDWGYYGDGGRQGRRVAPDESG
ncbi:hypothetical protein Tco_0626577 [Tanacetum coccineum]|uniref:Uncharacterized protein n=1 Tax=Tanacetum coccineum TaxID=301880 RepID=A0ABQ4WJY4_9ASTR